MRVLVLHAHPVAESYNGALHRAIVERLQARGHQVDDCDLYAEGFDPVLTREERLAYHDTQKNLLPVQDHVERLLAAEGFVICAPVWNFGYPAILKGYFDRVFLPGVSFDLVDGRVKPVLHNITRLCVVATYGATRFNAILAGDPPRKLANRVLRALIRPGAPVRYLAHHDMNRSTPQSRAAFLAKAEAEMDRF